jgi:hypothetical protein
MHDTGPLVPPKEGGPIAQLIAAIQQAKAYNDSYLTDMIEQEESRTVAVTRSISETVKKKARTDNV